MAGPRLQVLTPLTRGAGERRRRVFGGLEVHHATMVVLLLALPPALVLTLVLLPLLGSYALLVLLSVEVTSWWLFRARTRAGLGLRNFETIRDRRRGDVDCWFICGVVFDPGRPEIGTVMRADVGLVLAGEHAPEGPGRVPGAGTASGDRVLDDVLGRGR